MATKKIKWFRGDGTLYHPETEFSMVTGKLAKTQRADVLEVASLGSTSVPTYTVFASQTISAQGNTNSSYLVVGGGNFGGTYNGMWLVECSGRGSVATMRVTELAHNASGTVGFGHYVSSGKAYFGMTRSSYGAGIDIYHLNGALGELKLFQNNTTMPTGWTAVTPSILAKTSDLPDTSKFVTTDTAQTISGDKKFSKGTGANAHTEISILPYNGSSPTRAYGIDINTNATTATYGAAGISMSETQGAKYSYSFPKDSGTLALTKNIPDVSKYLPLTGGILTGDLKVGSATIQTNGYITGTWLQTTSTGTHLGSPATKVAVLDGSGWIYHRTPSELLGDMGGASTSYVDTKVANIVNSAPETLDTLNELAKALGNDPNFATTVSTQIGGKVSKSGDTMTGALKFAQSSCADADGPSYLLAMTSFSAGGEVKYTHVRNLTSKGNLQWTSATHTNATGYLFDGNYIPTINTLAYWNGAYSGTSSNLTYCAEGEILSKKGGTITGNLNANGTVDLTGFRNLGLSGTISHGSATLTLPSTTGTIALKSDIPRTRTVITITSDGGLYDGAFYWSCSFGADDVQVFENLVGESIQTLGAVIMGTLPAGGKITFIGIMDAEDGNRYTNIIFDLSDGVGTFYGLQTDDMTGGYMTFSPIGYVGGVIS